MVTPEAHKYLCTRQTSHTVCCSWRVEMLRGESVAVIYLSLLVCLALGQGTEGRNTTHNTTLVTHTHTSVPLKHSHTRTGQQLLRNIQQLVTPLIAGEILYMPQSQISLHLEEGQPLVSAPLPQVLVPSREGMHQTMPPPALPLRC